MGKIILRHFLGVIFLNGLTSTAQILIKIFRL
jgi:hypothetical protein